MPKLPMTPMPMASAGRARRPASTVASLSESLPTPALRPELATPTPTFCTALTCGSRLKAPPLASAVCDDVGLGLVAVGPGVAGVDVGRCRRSCWRPGRSCPTTPTSRPPADGRVLRRRSASLSELLPTATLRPLLATREAEVQDVGALRDDRRRRRGPAMSELAFWLTLVFESLPTAVASPVVMPAVPSDQLEASPLLEATPMMSGRRRRRCPADERPGRRGRRRRRCRRCCPRRRCRRCWPRRRRRWPRRRSGR